MSVPDIVKAIQALTPEDYDLFHRELERIEEARWKSELAKTTSRLKKKGITDRDIDRAIARRRHESRG